MAALPPLQIVEMPLEVSREHAADIIRDHGIRCIAGSAWEGVATTWERTGLCKVRAAAELLQEKLKAARAASEALVLFVRHHRVREALEKLLVADVSEIAVVSIFGLRKEELLREFAAGQHEVAICMIESCSVAIDLSRASICMFLELPSTVSEFNQAIARLHRQGQRSAVTAYVMLGQRSASTGSTLRRASSDDDAGDDQRIVNECAKSDRSHWFRLERGGREAAQLLGDDATQKANILERGGEQEKCFGGIRSSGDESGTAVVEASVCAQCRFVISAETQRLHVYDADGAHAGLISRAPAFCDIPLAQEDFCVVQGLQQRAHAVTVGEDLLVAARAFVQAHAELSAMDRRLLQRGRATASAGAAIGVDAEKGTEHSKAMSESSFLFGASSVHGSCMPVPCSAGTLSATLDVLRASIGALSPKNSTRRYALPASTQAACGGSTWALVQVQPCRGSEKFNYYRQRIDPETDSRYCLECYALLTIENGEGKSADGEAMIEKVAETTEDPLEQFSDTPISRGPRYIVRYGNTAEMFCGGPCYESYFVKRRSGSARSALLEMEGGVCQSCGLDTDKLRRNLLRMPSTEARGSFFEDQGGATRVEAAFFERLSEKRKRRVLLDPRKECFWEADHVRSVASGGGEATLSNLQTLCLSCHGDKTRAEAAARSRLKAATRETRRRGRGRPAGRGGRGGDEGEGNRSPVADEGQVDVHESGDEKRSDVESAIERIPLSRKRRRGMSDVGVKVGAKGRHSRRRVISPAVAKSVWDALYAALHEEDGVGAEHAGGLELACRALYGCVSDAAINAELDREGVSRLRKARRVASVVAAFSGEAETVALGFQTGSSEFSCGKSAEQTIEIVE
eukprot:TRINITY_DN31805_c0_g1_i1.p1 TRINITY_DN31805_c0_g1~~TRINITY_DN31805_c0_g1_i1.p1  ORF type:complete len:984 (+),score=158.81 TRINITY_DN31805_c0_g1_i1:376-2952(+)